MSHLEWIWFVAVGLPVLFTAVVVHEVTHAIAAKLLGGRIIRISILPSFHVEAAFPKHLPKSRDRLMGLAPTILGIGLGVPLLAFSAPLLSERVFLVSVAWLALYSLPSPEDILLPEEDLSLGPRGLVLIGLLCMAVVAPMDLLAGGLGGSTGAFLQYVASGFGLGGAAVVTFGLVQSTEEGGNNANPSK